jgi:acyl-CoA thioesterase-1
VLAAVAALAAGVGACSGGSARGAAVAGDSSAAVAVPASAAAVPGTAVGAAPAATAACRPSGKVRVLMVGTSLTAGYGLDPEQSYPALLQRKADSAGLAVEIVNAGVSGETSAGALQRADWLLRGAVDVFYLETGANDGLRAFDPDATRENVRTILTKAHAAHPQARLLLAQMEAPTNLGPRYTSRFRAVFPEVARETGAELVPFLLNGVAGRAELNQGDGIHPNVAGERIVAANIWPSIERAARAAEARRGALDPCPAAH